MAWGKVRSGPAYQARHPNQRAQFLPATTGSFWCRAKRRRGRCILAHGTRVSIPGDGAWQHLSRVCLGRLLPAFLRWSAANKSRLWSRNGPTESRATLLLTWARAGSASLDGCNAFTGSPMYRLRRRLRGSEAAPDAWRTAMRTVVGVMRVRFTWLSGMMSLLPCCYPRHMESPSRLRLRQLARLGFFITSIPLRAGFQVGLTELA